MKIVQTKAFATWLRKLKDVEAKARILTRLDRLKRGNPGDHRNLAGGISELRLTVGPGYRIYYCQRGEELIIILCGGDKSTQSSDIERVQRMAREI